MYRRIQLQFRWKSPQVLRTRDKANDKASSLVLFPLIKSYPFLMLSCLTMDFGGKNFPSGSSVAVAKPPVEAFPRLHLCCFPGLLVEVTGLELIVILRFLGSESLAVPIKA